MEAWRIVTSKHEAGAFSGEGASRYGGRWNSIGTKVVYVSSSLSLAALEMLVHLPAGCSISFRTFRVRFKKAWVQTLEGHALPQNWQEEPPAAETQAIGDAWAQGSGSAVLAVPSAIVPHEQNFLLNPAHPDFAKIQIDPATPFAFDPRLLKKLPA